MIHKARCSIEEAPYDFLRSYIKFQGHTGWKIDDLDQILARLLGRSQLSNPSDLPCFILSNSLWVIFVTFSYIATLLGSFLWKFDTSVGVKIHPADTPVGVNPSTLPVLGRSPPPGFSVVKYIAINNTMNLFRIWAGLDIKHLVYIPIGHVDLKVYMPCKNMHVPSQYLYKLCKGYVHCWENKYMPRLKNHLPCGAHNHNSLCALRQDLHASGKRARLNVKPCWVI